VEYMSLMACENRSGISSCVKVIEGRAYTRSERITLVSFSCVESIGRCR